MRLICGAGEHLEKPMLRRNMASSRVGRPTWVASQERKPPEGLATGKAKGGPKNMDDLLIEGGVIRKLWAHERSAYLDHLLRLDADSRHARFGGAVADEVIRRYVEGADPRSAVLHGFFVDGTLRGIGELRLLGGVANSAEAAFSIEKPWQSHGVGSALLERTLLTARNRGIKHLQMVCLADNRRMQELARKFDAELSFDFGSVIGEVVTPYPTPLSMFRELVSDGRMVASAVLEAQIRLLRAAA
jgi:GNAT superfamily N-acetyltransferase